MRVMTVVPGRPGTATVADRPDPGPDQGSVLVEGLLLGLCGTDLEIVRDGFGIPAPGRAEMVLGHESLGRVLEAPAGSGLVAGDLVSGVVRRPDGCAACAADEWDMCLDDGFTELGIRRADGYGATRWRADPRFVVRLDPALGEVGVLLEPTSVVAKAWEQVERIGARAHWAPRSALITGAGPIGLLAALLGVQRGLDVHVVDLPTEGVKPSLVRDLGATYHSGPLPDRNFDVVLECTGDEDLIGAVLHRTTANGVVCLAGISVAKAELSTAAAPLPQNRLVLTNGVVFGTVNAALRHSEQAAVALAAADPAWLGRLITRRVPLSRWWDALDRGPDDVKTVVDLQA